MKIARVMLLLVAEMWKGELMQKRERLLSLDKMILLNNEGVGKKKNTRTKSTKIQSTTTVTGSFRKLNID